MAQNSIHILLVEDDNLAVELFISHAAKISNGDIWEVDHVGLMADVKALDAYDIVI